MRSTGIRLIVWVLLNLFLIASILFVLDYFKIWSVTKFYNDLTGPKTTIAKIEDPNLLEKEELKKAIQSLNDREEILKVRERALEEQQKHYNDVKLKLKEKSDRVDEKERKLIALENEKNDRNKNIQDLANKISNMPPAQAVTILKGLDTLLIIDILRQIDQNAEEAGTQSISSYLITLIAATPEQLEGGQGDPNKAQEIFRLYSKFPGENLEIPNSTVNPQDEPVNNFTPAGSSQPDLTKTTLNEPVLNEQPVTEPAAPEQNPDNLQQGLDQPPLTDNNADDQTNTENEK